MGKAFEFRGRIKEEFERDILLRDLQEKLVLEPELEGVLKKLISLDFEEATKVQIQITEQDFIKCENKTYEKIIQKR